ncbi:MAG: hypothetical protein IIY21_28790, partial [Clostridiales bacterium]|nr:hypothetical protein [Clostridiales bacterium]
MKVSQIYTILNDVFSEVTGKLVIPEDAEPLPIVEEDLKNIVDIGKTISDYNLYDNYVKSMINRIGRDIYVDRTYEGYAPDVLRDSWEYGSIMSKTRCKVFDAKANPAWALTAGTTVNQFEFNPPEVTQKFYNNATAWQIDCSFTDYQIRESFKSAADMNKFMSMIENRINVSLTIYRDSLVMRTINNFIGEKLYASNGVVDLLAGYNATIASPITAAEALYDKNFLRYAACEIKLWLDRFKAPSVNFNTEEDNVSFTPQEYAHLVLHSDLARRMEVYLQSDTYHDDLVKIGEYETVPFWQSQGDNYQLAITSRIEIELGSSTTASKKAINRNYIVGVLFDRDALGVLCEHERVNAAYNANGEYWNNFYKQDVRYFNDLAENGIVFVLGNGEIPTITLSDDTATATLPSTTATVTATVSPA